MKNVAIDIGNTFAKIGIFENGIFQQMIPQLSYEQVIVHLHSIQPQYVIVSSVRQVEAGWLAALQNIATKVLVLHNAMPVPLEKRYDTPETLGVDRIAAAVGASVLFPQQHCMVIDLGTCITYDLVEAPGIFQGGIISPGMQMRFKAMHTFTGKLPLIAAEPSVALLGKSTKTAMQSGVVNGLLAEIHDFIDQYSRLLTKINVILCGGDATFFANRIKYPNFVIHELVLVGLNRILEYNV